MTNDFDNRYFLGEMNKNRQPNFLVVNTETPMSDIEGKYVINEPYV